jgi:MoxR-like ATPase
LATIPVPHDDVALAERLADAQRSIVAELRKLIVGQDAVIEQSLIALFAGGHSLIVGVPGLAKTLLVHTLAQALDLKFQRIQFTPDLMPTDITGTDIIQEDPATGQRKLAFTPGPVFANILLADEINRTPPKTQAALLEAMQEHRVTVQGRTYQLPEPFFVFATQNPIELEGTYPLPEAQLDRFMFNIVMDYLSEDDEVKVVTGTTGTGGVRPSRVFSGADIEIFQQVVRHVAVSDEVARYTVRLVDATRPTRPYAKDFVRKWVKWGAGLRASQALILAGKAKALLAGRFHVSVADVRALAPSVLRHRVTTSFYADAEQITPDGVIARLIESVPAPKSGL